MNSAISPEDKAPTVCNRKPSPRPSESSLFSFLDNPHADPIHAGRRVQDVESGPSQRRRVVLVRARSDPGIPGPPGRRDSRRSDPASRPMEYGESPDRERSLPLAGGLSNRLGPLRGRELAGQNVERVFPSPERIGTTPTGRARQGAGGRLPARCQRRTSRLPPVERAGGGPGCEL